MKSSIPAEMGTYCPYPGMTNAIPASPGYFVDTVGANHQTPAAPGYYVPTFGATNAIPAPAGYYAPTWAMRAALKIGDLNGDGAVSASEMSSTAQNYWATTTNRITGLTSKGQGTFQFGLTNMAGLSFSVLASTNLTDWQTLTNASPQLLFNDADATNATQRFYRLVWP